MIFKLGRNREFEIFKITSASTCLTVVFELFVRN